MTLITNLYIAICSSGCLHGNCTNPDSCTCDIGWTGDACNIGKAHVCILINASSDCKSYHKCTAICNIGCLHGNCTNPDTCTCDIGWTGDTCNIGIAQAYILNNA